MPWKGSSNSVAVIGTTFLRGCNTFKVRSELCFSQSCTNALHTPGARLCSSWRKSWGSLPAGWERPGEMGWRLASDFSTTDIRPCWILKTQPAFFLKLISSFICFQGTHCYRGTNPLQNHKLIMVAAALVTDHVTSWVHNKPRSLNSKPALCS